jgi:hypothetical protein
LPEARAAERIDLLAQKRVLAREPLDLAVLPRRKRSTNPVLTPAAA